MKGVRGGALKVFLAGALVLFAMLGMIAVSGASAAGCPNEQLRSEDNSTGLPDCRAYEMVSPPDKNGFDVQPFGAQIGTPAAQGSVSGNAVTYTSGGASPGSLSAGVSSTYLAVRGAGGWSSQAISPPLPPNVFGRTAFYDALPDLSKMILQTRAGPQADPNIYVRDSSSGALRLVTTAGPVAPNPGYLPEFESASMDFSHVVFDSSDPLAPGDPSGVNDLYDSVNGKLHLVNVRPGGTPDPGGAQLGAGRLGNLAHRISLDGSRIFFTSASDNQLYVRENDATTVQVSAPAPGVSDPAGHQPATFQAASADGSKVFFTSMEKLTSDSTACSTCSPAGADLYEYNVNSGVLKDLTVDAADPGGAGVNVISVPVVGASNNGSLIYFYASGRLGGQGVLGRPNLYLYRSDMAPASIILVATDNSNSPSSLPLPVMLTPDGRHLAFESTSKLKTLNAPEGYDNTDVNTGVLDGEVFLYDANTNSLSCASCNPSGARPIGPSTLISTPVNEFPPIPLYAQRNLSDDGSRLFFNSADALVPGDTNGKIDVYEYSQGQVHLISSGTSGSDSLFMDASPSGSDVFFLTRQQLVGQDRDGLVDLYDARAGGGLSGPPRTPVECANEGCQGPAGESPGVLPPASQAVLGLGNLLPSTVPMAHSRHKPRHRKHGHRARHRHQPRRSRRASVRARSHSHAISRTGGRS